LGCNDSLLLSDSDNYIVFTGGGGGGSGDSHNPTLFKNKKKGKIKFHKLLLLLPTVA
jgi:hypothetical protein